VINQATARFREESAFQGLRISVSRTIRSDQISAARRTETHAFLSPAVLQ
jgi:hypothetical protein